MLASWPLSFSFVSIVSVLLTFSGADDGERRGIPPHLAVHLSPLGSLSSLPAHTILQGPQLFHSKANPTTRQISYIDLQLEESIKKKISQPFLILA